MIVSELENPQEYEGASIFREAMDEITLSQQASQEFVTNRNKALRAQLLKFFNYV